MGGFYMAQASTPLGRKYMLRSLSDPTVTMDIRIALV